jgi:hypothetical protein
MSIRSGDPQRLAQRLPADQRAPEREKRLVDVGPLVVADAQASELVNQANVRSTTQRNRRRPLPCGVRRMASKGTMCRIRRPRRMAAAS